MRRTKTAHDVGSASTVDKPYGTNMQLPGGLLSFEVQRVIMSKDKLVPFYQFKNRCSDLGKLTRTLL